MYEFETPEPITLAVRLRAGQATLTAEPRDTATVEVTPYDGSEASREAVERTRVELQGGTLIVDAPESGGGWRWRRGVGVRVVARVPIDSVVEVKVASADADLLGRWREGSVATASGDLRVAEITGDLAARTGSGDLDMARVGRGLRASTASGDITVGHVGGAADLRTASGDIRIDDARASVSARTASGDIDLGQAQRGEVRVQSASGDVTVGVAAGTSVYLDVRTVSGGTRSDLTVADRPASDKGPDLTVYARTTSGDVAIVRGAPRVAQPDRAAYT